MMRKIGVIGLGNVGATVAYTIVTKGLADELVLIDSKQEKCTAEYYDLLDSLGRLENYTKLIMQDYQALADADVVITAFGDIKALAEGGDRFLEYHFNKEQAKQVGSALKQVGFNGVIINISNPCDVITGLLQYHSGLSKQQVFGTGTFLDTARMQRAVSQALRQNPHNIEGYVLGEHGESQFAAWSTITVQGEPIVEIAEKLSLNLADLDKAAREGGWLVFNGKKYTSYAIATCAVKLAQAVISDAYLACPVSVYLEQYQCYVGYPAVVARSGIVGNRSLALTADEQQLLATSAKMIAEKTREAL
ncbi:lactate/malate family dehydrogenase [Gallibacterium anatis]|uniref:lactate/malate family dehydrogenase n=1 Tax=Gallibacterium anatis TaxID=750 RepID=UPI001E3BF65D|nr:NAD(P)-binding domain-containing protein [Gallibacterium anatis]